MTCPDLPHRGLLYEVQYRTTFDSAWQVSGGIRVGQRAGASPGEDGDRPPRRRVRL